MTEDDVHQAYSYAVHPAVNGVYYCLCNGREFRIYQTSRSYEKGPCFSVTYEELREDSSSLDAFLSPAAVLREFPDVSVGEGSPVAPGFRRSFLRIVSGSFRVTHNTLGVAQLNELIYTIRSGTIHRGEEGKVVAFVTTTTPLQSQQLLNERLGLDRTTYHSDAESLSADPQHPTTFQSSTRTVLPANEPVHNLATGQYEKLPTDIQWEVRTTVVAHVVGQAFVGSFRAEYFMNGTSFGMSGEFHAEVR